MKQKRIIAVILAATLVLGSSLTAGATETEEIQTLTDQETESEEEAVSEETESEEIEAKAQEISEEIIADDDVLAEEDAEIEEEVEGEEEEEEDEDVFGKQLSTDTSGDTELEVIDPELIGYFVETDGIQTYASYQPISYSYDYDTFTKTVDGHSGDEILDKTVDIVVANEGGYTTVLANDNNSGALSIGKIGWHGDLALVLVRLIATEDNATAYNLLGADLYEEVRTTSSWSSKVLTNDEVTRMQNFLDPDQNPASKTIQDKLARSYVADYVNKAYDLGIRNAAALVYYADIHNQYGNTGGSMGGAKACANYAYNIAGDWSKVTLNELHLAAISNVAHNYASRSTIQAYLERRRSTYGKLVSCGWTYCNSGDHTIPYDSNGYVGAAWLQVALNYYQNAGLSVTGNYDDALKSAVKKYQQSVGLSADGLAGLHTSTKLIHDMYYVSMQTYGAAPSFSASANNTDIVLINGQWVYTVNGVVDYSHTGVDQNAYGWWYVKNGVVDFSYNGFAQNSNGWWYIESGKVIFSKNSVIQDTNKKIDGKDGWWYVVGGKVQTSFTGVANYSNAYGWWYIKNGKVDFSANTVAQNDYGWWYVVGGKVQFSYTGVGNYSNSNGWWYIKNGKVDFSANTIAQNDYGWWYIKNGKVDFSANTVAQNNYGWWYVTGGKVQFGYTGVANYSNPYGWWYIKAGKVDFSANTVAQNNNGWWYVDGGKVIFSFNGIAQNNYGWWYIKNGKVDFSFTGTVTADGKKYSVTKGKVAK